MPITSVTPDAAALSLTVVADFPVPLARLWEAYADPRQLERFWGPVEWPATFLRHDFAPGGWSNYYMRGPDGTIAGGWWRFITVEPMSRFEVEDGFSDPSGQRNDAMPTMVMSFAFEATGAGSRVTTRTRFPSLDAMEQLVKMGMMEGMQSAMGQMDAVLADLATFAATRATDAQLLDDTHVRVSRVVRGTVEQVWRAHTDPTLMPRWLTGPDGWRMTTCEVATTPGAGYRYAWTQDGTGTSFGFEGVLLEQAAPARAVTTERMAGTPGPETRNELTLTAVPGGTLIALVITYPSREVRDMVLGTGMTTGMETSYQRLEREVLSA